MGTHELWNVHECTTLETCQHASFNEAFVVCPHNVYIYILHLVSSIISIIGSCDVMHHLVRMLHPATIDHKRISIFDRGSLFKPHFPFCFSGIHTSLRPSACFGSNKTCFGSNKLPVIWACCWEEGMIEKSHRKLEFRAVERCRLPFLKG